MSILFGNLEYIVKIGANTKHSKRIENYAFEDYN